MGDRQIEKALAACHSPELRFFGSRASVCAEGAWFNNSRQPELRQPVRTHPQTHWNNAKEGSK